MPKAGFHAIFALLLVAGFCLQACQQEKPGPGPTPKYQGSDYKYYSPGAQGYGSPADPKK